MSRNYRLITPPRKFDVLETSTSITEASLLGMIFISGTFIFQGAIIRLILPRQKDFIDPIV